jgi:flavin-dependent dehydrogenase
MIALRSAELAVDTATAALRAGDCSAAALSGYARARRALFAGKERLTHALQFAIRHRRLANVTAAVLSRRPGLLNLVLGAIGDYVPAGALLSRRALGR